MPRYYVKKDEKWNVFSSIVDDFLYSDFMSFEELKALVIGEVVVEKLKDLKTLLTNRPKLNTMPFNEAMEIIKSKDEPQTHEIRTNTHECVKDTHDKTEPTGYNLSPVDKDINVRSKDENSSEISNNCDKYRCYKCWWWDYDHGCQTLYKCKYKPLDKDINVRSKTEPTISKMEQADEPQTCDNCELKGTTKWCNNQEVCRAYKPKDTPQTDCPWK